ncbi:MAG: DUF1320 domain-containing protein [Desulfobulbaceae bacterium]|jgi:phage gp36-like protein|nr:DUF1320 domain-containing protein [Desulfobulbaceae bacterium]
MYASPDDLRLLLAEKELVQLASDGRIGQWDDPSAQSVLAEAIDQADGEIDGYLSLVADVPLAVPPRLVRNLSAKIAVYNLLRRRVAVPDHWRGEYERCLKLLERIANGKMKLPNDGGGAGEDGAVDETALDPGRIVVVSRRHRDWLYPC